MEEREAAARWVRRIGSVAALAILALLLGELSVHESHSETPPHSAPSAQPDKRYGPNPNYRLTPQIDRIIRLAQRNKKEEEKGGTQLKTAPVQKKTAPVTKKQAPAVKKTAPPKKKAAPPRKKATPTVKKKEPAPVKKKVAPVKKKEAPVVKKKEPAPVKKEEPAAKTGPVQSKEPIPYDKGAPAKETEPSAESGPTQEELNEQFCAKNRPVRNARAARSSRRPPRRSAPPIRIIPVATSSSSPISARRTRSPARCQASASRTRNCRNVRRRKQRSLRCPAAGPRRKMRSRDRRAQDGEAPTPDETTPPPEGEAPPPEDGEAPPPEDQAPPPEEEAPPPPDEEAPPPDETAPPQDEAPPPDETAPPPDETAPPPEDGEAPPEDGAPPPDETAPPPEDGEAPPDDDAPPPEDDEAPPPEDGAPPPSDVTPPPSAPPADGSPPPSPPEEEETPADEEEPAAPADEAAEDEPEKPIAVVIAVDDYDNDALEGSPQAISNAAHVVRFLKSDLEMDDGRIITGRNAKLSDFEEIFGEPGSAESELRDVVKKTKSPEVIAYYAGRAKTLDGGDDVLLLPSDADPAKPETGVRLSALYSTLHAMGIPKLRIYLDPSFVEGDGVVKLDAAPRIGLFGLFTPKDWIALSAASDDAPLPRDSDRPRSLFTESLVAGLRGIADTTAEGNGDGIITAEELYLFTKTQAEAAAKRGETAPVPSLNGSPEEPLRTY